jgi:streptogrisin C
MRFRPALLCLTAVVIGTAPPVANAAPTPGQAPEHAAIVAAYLRDFPGMTEARARAAADAQGAVSAVVDALAATDEFGGAWFDPQSTVLHVYATDAGARAVRLGADHDLRIAVHRTAHSFRELDALADSINASRTRDEVAAGVVAKPESRWNRVTVVTPGARVAATRERFAHDGRVAVKARKNASWTVCVDRFSCGAPARSGTVIGLDGDGAGSAWADWDCSLGFTAAASDGSRWVVTAGHCSNGYTATSCPSSTACWGHGGQYFGPLRQFSPWLESTVDVARIRRDNSYWTMGGYMYNASAPESPVDVDGAITSFASVVQNTSVCQSMWHAVPGASCGLIYDTVSDVLGKVEVSLDSCMGDSGGGWYRITSGGRIAMGIQSQADNGPNCHGQYEHSYFSSLPDINEYWDATSAATIRVETR